LLGVRKMRCLLELIDHDETVTLLLWIFTQCNGALVKKKIYLKEIV